MKLSSDETGQRYTVSQLAQRAGMSTASIKFYLREGLLRGGNLRAEKKAYYDEGHLRRLVLVRALRELGRLSVEQVRKLVTTLDRGKTKSFALVASILDGLATPEKGRAGRARAALRTEVLAKLRARGLSVRRDSATLDSLVEVLLGLRVFSPALDVDVLDTYLDHLVPLARAEFLANLRSRARGRASTEARILAGPESALIGAIVGTVLFEPLIVLLRRLAHEHFAKQHFGRGPSAGEGGGAH